MRAKVSRFHPDPLRALEAAEAKAKPNAARSAAISLDGVSYDPRPRMSRGKHGR